ncbi:M15 family metallopeptidase [Kribbella sp. NPDC049174]|uniref:M15 family metallopeptidase n=1 Tax=Kribbella sp. NPDC049174 TaxID=3364112 RepID=UPI003711C374
MSASEQAQTAEYDDRGDGRRECGRRTRLPIRAALVVATAVLIGVVIHQLLAPSPVASPSDNRHGALGEVHGVVPDGVTVFDSEIPAVANLDPELLGALRRAATDAADDGVELFVSSGWRSPEYQAQLLREEVSKYGSEKEAARWVATPDLSPHVSGHAIDIGHSDAVAWLSRHGGEYGLCQIYRNEPWHFERRPGAVDHGCPPRYADPTHDPRTQQ